MPPAPLCCPLRCIIPATLHGRRLPALPGPGWGHGAKRAAGCGRASPGAHPRFGGCCGTLVQERAPSARCPGRQPGRERPTAPPGLDRTTDALCFPSLSWPRRGRFGGAAGAGVPRSPRGSPRGSPERQRPRGPGGECLCFIFLIKTKASKGAQPSGEPAPSSKARPRESPAAERQRDHGAAGVSGFPGGRSALEDSATPGSLLGSPPWGRSRPTLGEASPARLLFSRRGSLRSFLAAPDAAGHRALSLGAAGSLATRVPVFPPGEDVTPSSSSSSSSSSRARA
ncbi:uncharacterized protein VSU04_015078 [Chlamydotis macqueenii]